MSLLPYDKGSTGRYLVIDPSGRVVTTSDPAGGLYPLGFGSTGRAVMVDASGRLVTSPESSLPSVLSSNFVELPSATGITVNLNDGNNYFVDLEHDTTLTLNNPTDGATYRFVFRNNGTSDVTFPAAVAFKGATEPALTQVSGALDLVSLLYVGPISTYIGDTSTDFS